MDSSILNVGGARSDNSSDGPEKTGLVKHLQGTVDYQGSWVLMRHTIPVGAC